MARRSQWGIFRKELAIVDAGQDAFDISSAFRTDMGVNTLSGYTVVRVLGELSIRAVGGSSSGIAGPLAAGIMVSAGGVAPSADPTIDNANYMWHWIGDAYKDGNETSVGFFGARTRTIQIDTRAMRKIPSNDAFLFMQVHNSSGETLTVNYGGRVLYKLP